MMRVTSMKKLAALLFVATAFAGSSFAGVSHGKQTPGGNAHYLCPPVC